MKAVNGFCYLDENLNSSGCCEAAVNARVRIDWVDLENAKSCY